MRTAPRRRPDTGVAMLGGWCVALAAGLAMAEVVPPESPEIVLFEAARAWPSPFPDAPEPAWYRQADPFRVPGHATRRASQPDRFAPTPIVMGWVGIRIDGGWRTEPPATLPTSADVGMMHLFRVAQSGGLLSPDDATPSFQAGRDADRAEGAYLMARFRQLPSPGAPATIAVCGLAMSRRRRA